jgi:hypothetical protein
MANIEIGEFRQPPRDNKPLVGETIAELREGETILNFYRFIVDGTDPTRQVKLAGANARVRGVSLPDELMMDTLRVGGERLIRNGYKAGQPVSGQAHGPVPVEVGAGGCAKGQKGKSDANGKAIIYTKPTITPAGPTAAEVEAVRDAPDIIAGEFLEAGVEGDIVLFDLDRK